MEVNARSGLSCAPSALQELEVSATVAPAEAETEPTGEPTTTATETEAGGTTVYLPGVVTLQSFDYADWQTYRNMAYGFSFRSPPDWQIQEVTDPEDTMARHRVTLSTLTSRWRRCTSPSRQRTKTSKSHQPALAPARSRIVEASHSWARSSRRALVAEGKDFGVLYGGESEVTRGELVFWMGLNYVGDPATDPGLFPEFQTLVDQIITSLQIEP